MQSQRRARKARVTLPADGPADRPAADSRTVPTRGVRAAADWPSPSWWPSRDSIQHMSVPRKRGHFGRGWVPRLQPKGGGGERWQRDRGDCQKPRAHVVRHSAVALGAISGGGFERLRWLTPTRPPGAISWDAAFHGIQRPTRDPPAAKANVSSPGLATGTVLRRVGSALGARPVESGHLVTHRPILGWDVVAGKATEGERPWN